MKKLVFDIEADGLNPTKIWCIVAKDLDEGTCRTFNPNQLLDGVEYLQSADVLIGHNIIGFNHSLENYKKLAVQAGLNAGLL